MLLSGLATIYASLRRYQSNWMADSTKTARTSQWRIYLRFCDEFDRQSLPASMETILLYLAYLAESRSYVTIINYLSAVWSLHKLSGVPHLDPSSFEIQMTLKGIKRTLGDERCQARPITVHELKLVFSTLDMSNSEDVAFWLALLICFRGLLRKSNVVEQDLALLYSDVDLTSWGLLIKLRRTKTITCKERVLVIPFVSIASVFCVRKSFLLLSSMVRYPSLDSQLVSYMRKGTWVRATYSWLRDKLAGISRTLGLSHVTSHSLRRGGATALADADFTLLQIKDMGDWSSLAVLQYITKTMESRKVLDERMCKALFSSV